MILLYISPLATGTSLESYSIYLGSNSINYNNKDRQRQTLEPQEIPFFFIYKKEILMWGKNNTTQVTCTCNRTLVKILKKNIKTQIKSCKFG